MSIFKKIKLALFSSGFILASPNAYAMIEEDNKGLPKGLPAIGALYEGSNEPGSSSSPLLQCVVDELSARLAILNTSEGENMTSSSSVANADAVNDSEEGMATLSSSPPTLRTSSIHKDKLDDIAGRLAPIGSALKTFLGSSPTSPQTKKKSVSFSTSPREKRKSTKGRGGKNTLEISSPPPNSTKNTSIEDYQEELPNFLREFSDKFKAVNYIGLSIQKQKEFYQLLCSFRDVERIYQGHLNREYCSTLEPLHNDLHNITVVDTTRRFRLIRSATADFIKEEAEKAAARKVAAEEAAHQVVGEVGSEVDGIEEYKEPSLSLSSPSPSSPPLSPRGYGSLPPGLSKKDPVLPTTPTSPPLSPRGNRSFPSSPPPIPPGFSKNESSSFAPLLLPLQQEEPSSSVSVSPPSSSAPSRPPRSRSISTPVRKIKPVASSSPISPPSNKRWAAFYFESPVDLLSSRPD